MGRTMKNIKFKTPEKPRKIKSFRSRSYRLSTTISSLSRRNALLFQGRESYLFVKEMAIKEGVDETLKAKDQMAWVQAMNSIRSRAEEIVLRELIYGDSTV